MVEVKWERCLASRDEKTGATAVPMLQGPKLAWTAREIELHSPRLKAPSATGQLLENSDDFQARLGC